MDTKTFLQNFAFENPNWQNLPDDWPNPNTTKLSSSEIGKLQAVKTLWENLKPEKTEQVSRVWTDPEGYKFLVQWSNAVLLRYLIRKITDTLPILSYRGNYRNIKDANKCPLNSSNPPLSPSSSRPSEHRRKAQLDDAARSVVRNIEEGYKRATTKQYLDFLSYTQASLEEVKGDVVELAQDGFLKSRAGSLLCDIEIDLADFHNSLKQIKGFYRNLEDVYPVLAKIKGSDLTVEQFIELINKTDFLLRKLVESLEKKQGQNLKFYQVERARIQDAIKKR
ncbi:MAG: four helix bundle protein [Candidatus Staskawiczbacteria bacterium]|nr:four helix bundle protein [Candidatus Staskawiczbacteria bacterium]